MNNEWNYIYKYMCEYMHRHTHTHTHIYIYFKEQLTGTQWRCLLYNNNRYRIIPKCTILPKYTLSVQ